MFGVGIGPPYGPSAEKPTSSRTMRTTFGAPAGAFGGSNGLQSGTESRISMLITPWNGLVIAAASLVEPVKCPRGHPPPGSHNRTAGGEDSSSCGDPAGKLDAHRPRTG